MTLDEMTRIVSGKILLKYRSTSRGKLVHCTRGNVFSAILCIIHNAYMHYIRGDVRKRHFFPPTRQVIPICYVFFVKICVMCVTCNDVRRCSVGGDMLGKDFSFPADWGCYVLPLTVSLSAGMDNTNHAD